MAPNYTADVDCAHVFRVRVQIVRMFSILRISASDLLTPTPFLPPSLSLTLFPLTHTLSVTSTHSHTQSVTITHTPSSLSFSHTGITLAFYLPTPLILSLTLRSSCSIFCHVDSQNSVSRLYFFPVSAGFTTFNQLRVLFALISFEKRFIL